MFLEKLLIATISFAVPLTASTAVMAADGEWENHRDWGDWNDDHDWGDDDWNDDDWNDDDDDWDDDDWDDDDWGDNHHGGKKDARISSLEFIDKGERLLVFGELENMKKSNKPAKIHVKARGDALAVCIKPNGNIPAGKNPVEADEVDVFGKDQLDFSDFNKGVIDFKVATDRPDMEIEGAPDCPNWKWTEKIFDIAFTEVELTVIQDGKKVLELECFFDQPTDDGKVPRKQFDCEER